MEKLLCLLAVAILVSGCTNPQPTETKECIWEYNGIGEVSILFIPKDVKSSIFDDFKMFNATIDKPECVNMFEHNATSEIGDRKYYVLHSKCENDVDVVFYGHKMRCV